MAKSDSEVLPVSSDVGEMERAILGIDVPEFSDPEEISKAIMLRILNAENADEVFDQASAVHGRDVLNRPFRAHDFRLNRSSYEDGTGVFAVIDAEFLDDGERAAVTCGGRNVLAQLVALKKTGALPQDVRLYETDKPTAAGFKPLWLTRAKG